MKTPEDFRQSVDALKDFIIDSAGQRGKKVSEPEARQLALSTGRIIVARLDTKNVRPSAIGKGLPKLAKHLRKAADCANEMGVLGIQELLIHDHIANDDDWDPAFELERLNLFADLAHLAAQPANLDRLRRADVRGGPTRDLRIQPLSVTLSHHFERLLGISAKHTKDSQGGEAKSFFDQFVAKALSLFAPDSTGKPRAIEDAVGRALSDLKWYDAGMPQKK